MDDRAPPLPDDAASTDAAASAVARRASGAHRDDDDDDDALMRAAAAEDTAAFSRLMRRHEARLLGFLTRMLGHGDDARDVCQDVFVEVWRSRHRYRPEGRFVGWLFRIARSRAIGRGRRRQLQTLLLGRLRAAPTTPATGADDVVDDRAKRRRLEQALARMPAEAREVLALRHGAGLEYPAVAEVLGVSEAAARQRSSRALARLRVLLEEVEA
jgi:RNA polymerase sigma-70 factor (ECF subfamily)